MVGTGLRVDEALSLQWDDIKMVDRNKVSNLKNFGNGF